MNEVIREDGVSALISPHFLGRPLSETRAETSIIQDLGKGEEMEGNEDERLDREERKRAGGEHNSD